MAKLRSIKRSIIKRSIMVGLALWLACLAGLPRRWQGNAQANQGTLTAGSSVEREIGGGQTHSYALMLSEQQYLEINFEQCGLKLTARLLTPEGNVLASLNETSWSNIFVKGGLAGVAAKAGAYRLEMKLDEEAAMKGRYALKVATLRAAQAQDAERIQAHQLLTQARELQNQPKPESRRASVEKCEQAQTIWHALNEPAREAEALDEAAWSYYLLGNAAKVEAASQQALSLWRGLGRQRDEARTLSQLGALAYTKFEQAKAHDFYRQALAMHESANDQYWQGETLNRWGWVYRSTGDLAQAKDCFLRALPLRRAVFSREGESTALNDLGRVFDELGEKFKAVEYFQQALALRPAAQNPAGAASVLNRLGITYDAMGESQKALDVYLQALQLVQQIGDRRTEASLRANVGYVYAGLGDLPNALNYYEQGLKLTRELGIRNGEATILNNLGIAYVAAKDWAKAASYYEQSLAIHKATNNRVGQAQVLQSLGNLNIHMKRDQPARELFSQSLALGEATGDRRVQATSFSGLAVIAHAAGNRQQALDYYEKALALYRAIVFPVGEWRILRHLAVYWLESGETAKARALLEESLRLIETLRQNVISQELRATFFATAQDKYELYVDVLMQSGNRDDVALALETNERALARSLVELLAESRADVQPGVSPALLQDERNLQQRLNTRAEAQTRLLSGKHTPAQAAAAAQEIAELTAQYRQLQAQVRAASPRYAALTQPQPLTLAAVQKQLLDADTLLLEYALGEKRSYLWVVSQATVTSYQLPARAEIESVARQVYQSMSQRPAKPGAADEALATQAGALSRMLLGPAAAQLGQKRLLIVAPGVLSYLPFAALPDPVEPGSGKGEKTEKHNAKLPLAAYPLPLMARHEIVNLPSAAVLAALRQEKARKNEPNKTVAVMADPVFESDDPRLNAASAKTGNAPAITPAADLTRSLRDLSRQRAGLERLPFSRAEADAILSFVPANAGWKAVDFNANRAAALDPALGRYRIVHFATHGVINSQHPELSGLVLSLLNERGEPQDGFLRLHEIYNLQLPADLIVLSGCQTGLGQEIKGEGLIGLTRGFMYAGAPRVVASLWSVGDLATAELMKRFYRGMLQEKLRPAAALRAAQLELSRSRRNQAPYYWAAFTLQGEWR